MKKYDLHIHSKFSDGDYSVEEIVDKLKLCGIDIFSIADHDNIQSIKAMKNVELEGLIYIPGVEISCEKDEYRMHILGYNIDANNEELIKLLQDMKLRKNLRNLEIIQQLKEKFGVVITKEETEGLLKAKNFVGQTTIARILTERRDIPNTQYAFDHYFKHLDLKTPATAQLEQAIKIIHNSGGYAVLAHPISLEKTYGVNIEDIFEIFRDVGLDGIEIFNSKHTLSDIKRYLKLAKKENLLISGGSDFHGEIMKPNIKLGALSKDNSEKEHHYKMTILSKCIDKSRMKNIYDGDEIEL